MKFSFRLEAVLDLRRRAEDEAERVLALAHGRVAEADARIAQMEAQWAATLTNVTPDTPFDERLAARRWCDVLASQIERAQVERETLAAIADHKRQELARATAERRAVEKLRERALAEHGAEMQRREQIALDESARTRYAATRQQG